MTESSTDIVLTPEQQERADRFVQLLILTRTLMGSTRPASRRALSKQLDVSATMLNRYETGTVDPAEVRYGVISKLARVLGVSLSAVDLYLLQDRRHGLLEHPAITPVAHLLNTRPGAALTATATTAPAAWATQLQALSTMEQANGALRLMQKITDRILELGGASAGRAVLLERMTEGLKPRPRQQLQKKFDAHIRALLLGQLPLEPEFWDALARPAVGLIDEAIPPEKAVPALLQELALTSS